MWPRAFRHWMKRVVEFSAGRVPQDDDAFIAECELPPDPRAVRFALAVRKVFAEEGSVDPQLIHATDRYPEDLGVLPSWDSIDLLDLIFRLERELKVKVRSTPFTMTFTVRQFIHTLIAIVAADERELA